MNTKTTLAALALLAVLTAGPALAGSIDDEPGCVDLDWIEIPRHADEIHDIDLTSMLIELADDAREDGEAELAELLSVIRSVRLLAFSLDDGDDRTEKAVEKLLDQLDKDDWNRMIYTKSRDELVSVNSFRHDGRTVALTVVAYEPGEGAAFINVVGELDLATLIRLASEYDLDDLDAMVSDHERME